MTMQSLSATLMASAMAMAAPSLLVGCQYDIDKVFSHTADAGLAKDAGVAATPDDLLALWGDKNPLSEACVACAQKDCTDVNESCRADEQCVAFTRCVAEHTDPAHLADCRSQFRDWLSDPAALYERDTGGPFAQCVFQQRCDTACGSRSDLSCSGNFNWPTTSERSLSYRIRLTNTNGTAVAGVAVKVCGAENPLQCNASDSEATDQSGVADLTFPVGSTGVFQGYLELTGTDIYPSLLRFGWPLARNGVTNVTVIPKAVYDGLILVAPKDVQLNDERGLLQLRTFGCSGVGTTGISYSVLGHDDDPSIRSWYTVSKEIYPNFEKTQTDGLGAGGIVNVPPGLIQVRAVSAKDQSVVAELRTTPVRKGFMTIVVLAPNAN